MSDEGTLFGLAARVFLIFRSDDEGDGNFVMKYNSALIVYYEGTKRYLTYKWPELRPDFCQSRLQPRSITAW